MVMAAQNRLGESATLIFKLCKRSAMTDYNISEPTAQFLPHNTSLAT